MTSKLPWREREQRLREAAREAQERAVNERRYRHTMRWTRANFFVSFAGFLNAILLSGVATTAISYSVYYLAIGLTFVGLIDLNVSVGNPSQSVVKLGVVRVDNEARLNDAYFRSMSQLAMTNEKSIK